MLLSSHTRIGPMVAALAVVACGDATPPGSLEIGVRAADDKFTPLADGDPLPMLVGASGIMFSRLALRATHPDLGTPGLEIEVNIGAEVVASYPLSVLEPWLPDGIGQVLWDVPVGYMVPTCCVACQAAALRAVLIDGAGRTFEQSISVELRPGLECPDETLCCASADDCPASLEPQVCP